MRLKKFSEWWRAATAKKKRQLAARSGSSYVSLSNAAHGARKIGAERAARIELASKGELPRGELAEVCARCTYYKNNQNN